MTPEQIKKFREDNKIMILDVSARSGLQVDYIEKIESGSVPALESDLARLERAIRQAMVEKSDPDYEEERDPRLWDEKE